MGVNVSPRAVTVGFFDGMWFTRTDTGVMVWHATRAAAVSTARQWMDRNRPARVLLQLDEEISVLFEASA